MTEHPPPEDREPTDLQPPTDGRPAPQRAATGADLAREALRSARAQNAHRRAAQGRAGVRRKRTGSAGALRRTRWSGPGPDVRDPAPLGRLVENWVKQSGNAAEVTRATVFARWSEIVGPSLAEHCRPISLVDGELTVQAESTAWATQIRVLAGKMLAAINAAAGAGSVRRIRAQGPTGPSWKFGPRHVPGRGPRDTFG